MSVEQEILETGIKVVDMLAPYAKGGKIGKSFMVQHDYYIVNLVKISCVSTTRNKYSRVFALQNPILLQSSKIFLFCNLLSSSIELIIYFDVKISY